MIKFISILMLAALSFVHTALALPVIKDFKKHIFHGDSKHPHLWAIEIAPPPTHHFNLEAPRSAQQEKFRFDLVQESSDKILFQADHKAIHAGSVIEVSAFVCDEKKTYCMKKKMFVTLEDKNASVMSEKFSNIKETKIASVPVIKESDLFIDNDPVRALNEAKTSKKPIMIDFYGIWCPPCNLYNETIFNTKEFGEQAKKYVLLKMDADHEKSFELKSKFKIGGYPTLLIAKYNDQSTLEEVERIVGYFPPREFYAKLNQAYAHRNDSVEQRWKGRLEERLTSLLEQKNFDEIIKLTTAGNQEVQEAKIQLYRWIAQVKNNENFLKDEVNLKAVKETISEISKNMQKQSSDTLLHAVDFLNSEFWLKQKEYKKTAENYVDQLMQRIDPNTLFVKGSELTAPDLYAIKMDLAETLENHEEVSALRKKAIIQYEKLINFFANKGNKDLRSMNLEYAFLLWKDGRVDQAKNLYSKFLQKYPVEFTFNYAAAKMYLTLKEYPKARELSEKALKYSYGDNRIRAMDRLVTVMAEQGFKEDAILRGNEFLKNFKVPKELHIRTARYVEALKQTIAKIENSGLKQAEAQ